MNTLPQYLYMHPGGTVVHIPLGSSRTRTLRRGCTGTLGEQWYTYPWGTVVHVLLGNTLVGGKDKYLQQPPGTYFIPIHQSANMVE